MVEMDETLAGRSGPAGLSVLITSWNTRDLLADLLSSLSEFPSGVGTEIVVVDNDSADGSAEMVESAHPEVVLIRNDRNRGFAAGNNQALAASSGRAVLLLGSDTRVLGGTLKTMLDYLDAHPGVGAVSCRLLYPDGSPQLSCRRFPRVRDAVATYLSLHFLVRGYEMRDFDFDTIQEVDQPAATCLLIRRTVIEDIGLFDERYSILYNDVDLCERIWKAGSTIVYHGGATVIHHGSSSTTQAPPELRLEMYRNILRYFTQRFGIRALIALFPILLVRLAVVTRGRQLLALFRFREYLW
jgi:GT2 family glycosyltransferase